MDAHTEPTAQPVDRQARILDATLKLLARHGISGVSVRAVAREAEVALGLVNYHYADKTSLIRAVLHRIEEQDVALLAVNASLPPEKQVRLVLRRIAEPQFLTQEYLSLRLQLWALAQAHEDFADINTRAQKKYRSGLAALIRAARPAITRGESNRRAADIDVLQNGLWLTALLGLDQPSIRRCVRRCEEIAFADH
ncbi:TetR/AcrR family transcriptional regulator [Streptomyces sp. NPDC050523]|uniref:TetR/AcrR family transcriptional regulator n=1 Tax=Streptomyces sp. NPDC050523 TaxID=3365622 RepID=UPI0037B53027